MSRPSLTRLGPAALSGVLLVVGVVGGACGWWIGGFAAQGLPPRRSTLAAVLLVVAVVVIVLVGTALARWLQLTVDHAAVAEQVAGAPVLAHLQAPASLTAFPTLEPGSVQAAEFEHLRRTTDRRIGLPSPLLVVVAGVVSGDTAVWVGANLAIAMAQGGRRVLLVDARLGERFGQPGKSAPEGPGLDGVLGGAALSEAVSPGPVEGLGVLPPGRVSEEWSEEVLRNRFAERLGAGESGFEVVVALGPPLDLCADTRLMAESGLLVLAVPERQVRVRSLQVEADRVRAAGVRLLGLVMVSSGAETGS